jgi:hypothetical protein
MTGEHLLRPHQVGRRLIAVRQGGVAEVLQLKHGMIC